MLKLRLVGITKNVALIFVYSKFTTFKIIINYITLFTMVVSKTSAIFTFMILTVQLGKKNQTEW